MPPKMYIDDRAFGRLFGEMSVSVGNSGRDSTGRVPTERPADEVVFRTPCIRLPKRSTMIERVLAGSRSTHSFRTGRETDIILVDNDPALRRFYLCEQVTTALEAEEEAK